MESLGETRTAESAGARRLHWGCGHITPPGWINSDLWEQPGVDVVGDILAGLPLEDDSMDYIVSNHALPEIDLYDQEPALQAMAPAAGFAVERTARDLGGHPRAVVIRRPQA